MTKTTSTPNNQDVWVIVPAYNEQGVIGLVLDELLVSKFNVVVVDDASSDDTYNIAREKKKVHVLHHIVNSGQGAALETGKRYAISCDAKYICTFDADGQHQLEDITALLQALKKAKADIAIGSRFLGGTVGIPKSRWILLKFGILFHRIFYGIRLTDTHNGLRLMTQDAARKIAITIPGMAHATEILSIIHEQKLKVVEVPVIINYTEYSLDKGQGILSFINTLKALLVGSLYK